MIFFLLTRQERKKNEEYGDLKTYEASQEPNNSSLIKIIIKSQKEKTFKSKKKSFVN